MPYKWSETYENSHPFTKDDIQNLPSSINHPIAVFNTIKGKNDKIVLVELQKDGKNFVVAVKVITEPRKGGNVIELNEIRSLYPKDKRGIIQWFNDKRATYIDKEKAQNWLRSSQPHAEPLTDSELISAAKVINDFGTDKENAEKVEKTAEKTVESTVEEITNLLDQERETTNRKGRFFIGKKKRAEYEALLDKKQPEMPEKWKKEALDYLHSLEDTKDNNRKIKVAVKWLAEGTIRLPEDMEKVEDALSVADKAKVDPMAYKSPMDLMENHKQFKPSARPINPDTVPTLRNKQELANGVVVYDVDNTQESRENMRKIINTHFGEDCSPWCLLQGDGNGNLTEQSARYWDHYGDIQKQVAFQNGKLLAFRATNEINQYGNNWRDTAEYNISENLSQEYGLNIKYEDGECYIDVPMFGEYDILGAAEMLGLDAERYGEYTDGDIEDESTWEWSNYRGCLNDVTKTLQEVCDSEMEEYKKLHEDEAASFGQQAYDDEVESWWDRQDEPHVGIPQSGEISNDRLKEYFDEGTDILTDVAKGKKIVGTFEILPNGTERGQLTNLHSGSYKKNGEYTQYDEESGRLIKLANFKHGKLHGRAIDAWYTSGDVYVRNYKDGELHGLQTCYDANWNVKEKTNYKNGDLDGERIKYWSDGSVMAQGEFKDGHPVGRNVSYYSTGGINEERFYDDNGNVHGDVTEWYEDGNVKRASSHNHGKMEGLDIMYREDGSVISKCLMINGLSNRAEYYRPDGTLERYQNGIYEHPDKNGYIDRDIDTIIRWNHDGEFEFFAAHNSDTCVKIIDGKATGFIGSQILEDADVPRVTSEDFLSGTPIFGVKYEPVEKQTVDGDSTDRSGRRGRFYIGKRARAEYEALLNKKQPNMSSEWKTEALDYLHSLEDTKENNKTVKVAVKWLSDGTIRLPQDIEKVNRAIKTAERAKIDPMGYSNPMELLETYSEYQPKEKPIDPDTVPTLSNKKKFPNGITVYDVEDSEQSRKNMREIINTHLGKDTSPWCLLQGDKNGVLTDGKDVYWDHYGDIQKQVAFKDGKLLAFRATDEFGHLDRDQMALNALQKDYPDIPIRSTWDPDRVELDDYPTFDDLMKIGERLGLNANAYDGEESYDNLRDDVDTALSEEYLERRMYLNFDADSAYKYGIKSWWDRQDQNHVGIPVTMAIDNPDVLEGDAATDSENHKVFGTFGILPDGTMTEPTDLHRGNKHNGEYVAYDKDGNVMYITLYKDGKRDGECKQFYGPEWINTTVFENDKPRKRETVKNGIVTSYETYDKDGRIHGVSVLRNEKNGNMIHEYEWNHGKRLGLSNEYDHRTGIIDKSVLYLDGDVTIENNFYDDGSLLSTKTRVKGEIDGISKSYHRNGTLSSERLIEKGKLIYLAEYSEDGKMIRFKDSRSGTVEEWDNNGLPQIVQTDEEFASWVMGKPNSHFRPYFDDNHKLVREELSLDDMPTTREPLTTTEKAPSFSDIESDYYRNQAAIIKEDRAEVSVSERSGRFSVVTDKKLKAKLEKELNTPGEYIEGYHGMVLIDGVLYPPMNSMKKNAETGKKELYDGVHEGDIVASEEHPEKAKKKILANGEIRWTFDLPKSDGTTCNDVAYDPYLHATESVLNDQFKGAYSRPDLVTVRLRIPKSEISGFNAVIDGKERVVGGYWAGRGAEGEWADDDNTPFAMLPTGVHKWHTGPVASKIKDTDDEREVMLTRYFKIMEIVPDKEVAAEHARISKKYDIAIPVNTMTPTVAKLAAEMGAKIAPPETGVTVLPGMLDLVNAEAENTEQYYKRIGVNPKKNPNARKTERGGRFSASGKKNTKVIDVTDIPLVTHADVKSFAEDNYKEYDPIKNRKVWKSYINKDTGNKIALSSKGINKSLSNKAKNKSVNREAHIKAIGKLPAIIEESILDEVHPDKNGSKDVKEVQRYYGTISLNGELYRVKTTVKKVVANREDKNKYYSLEIQEMELTEERPDVQVISSKNTGNTNSVNSISKSKVTSSAETEQTNEEDNVSALRNINNNTKERSGRFSTGSKPFYSNAAKAVEGISQDKATPEMRDSVRRGQPMFYGSDAGSLGKDWVDPEIERNKRAYLDRLNEAKEEANNVLTRLGGQNLSQQQGRTRNYLLKPDQQSEARRAIANFVNAALSTDNMSVFSKRALKLISSKVAEAKTTHMLRKHLMEAETVCNDAEIARLKMQIDSYLKLKIQDQNDKGISIGKLIDDDTRKVFEYMKGRTAELRSTEVDDELKAVGAELREIEKTIKEALYEYGIGDAQNREERNAMVDANPDLETEYQGEQRTLADLKAMTEPLIEQQSNLKEQQEEIRAGKRDNLANWQDRLDELTNRFNSTEEGVKPLTENEKRELEGLQILSVINEADKLGYTTQVREDGQTQESVDSIRKQKKELFEKNRQLRMQLGENFGRDDMYIKQEINKNNNLIDNLTLAENAIKEQQIDFYRQGAEAMKQLIEDGHTKRSEELEAEKNRRDNIIIRAVRDAKKGNLKLEFGWQGFSLYRDIEHGKKWDEDSEEKKHSIRDWMVLTPFQSFEFMSQWVSNMPAGRGFLYNHFTTGLIKAEENLAKDRDLLVDELDKKCYELFEAGETWRGWRENVPGMKTDAYRGAFERTATRFSEALLDRNLHKINLKKYHSGVTLFDDNGDPISSESIDIDGISKGTALQLWMWWQNPDGQMKMRNMGFDEESVQQLENYCGTKLLEFGQWLFGFYDRLGDRTNEVHKLLYGTSMHRTPNYSPLKIDRLNITEKSNIADGGNSFSTNLNKINGSLINRTVNMLPVSLKHTVFDILSEHVEKNLEMINFARMRKDLDYLLKSQAFRNTLNANKAGQYKDFVQSAEVAARVFTEDVNGIDKALGAISSNFAGGAISWRVWTAIKQVMSYPAFYAYKCDPRYWSAVSARFWSILEADPKIIMNNIHWANENLPLFKARWNEGLAGNQEILRGVEGLKKGGFWRLLTEKNSKLGMMPNRFIDAMTVAAGARAIYDFEYERLKKHYTKSLQGKIPEEKIDERAHELANEQALFLANNYNTTQQSSVKTFLSRDQESKKAIERAHGLFQNSNRGFTRVGYLGARDALLGLNKKNREQWVQKYQENLGMTEKEARSAVRQDIATAVTRFAMNGFAIKFIWDATPKAGRAAIVAAYAPQVIPWLSSMVGTAVGASVGSKLNHAQIGAATGAAAGYGVGALLTGSLGLAAIQTVWQSIFDNSEDDSEEQKEASSIAWDLWIYGNKAASFFSQGSYLGNNYHDIMWSGNTYDPMTIAGKIEADDILKAWKEEGGWSPQFAGTIMRRIPAFLGFKVDTYTNIYLGASKLIEDWGCEPYAAIDVMMILNCPNSMRKETAAALSKDYPLQEFVKAMAAARKLTQWGAFGNAFFGTRAMNDKAINEIKEEWVRLQIGDTTVDKFKEFNKNGGILDQINSFKSSLDTQYNRGMMKAEAENFRNEHPELFKFSENPNDINEGNAMPTMIYEALDGLKSIHDKMGSNAKSAEKLGYTDVADSLLLEQANLKKKIVDIINSGSTSTTKSEINKMLMDQQMMAKKYSNEAKMKRLEENSKQ